MLAVAYALLVDEISRDVQALTIAAAVAAALGGEAARPDWGEIVAAFDEDLAAPPVSEQDVDMSARGIKLRALGLGGDRR